MSGIVLLYGIGVPEFDIACAVPHCVGAFQITHFQIFDQMNGESQFRSVERLKRKKRGQRSLTYGMARWRSRRGVWATYTKDRHGTRSVRLRNVTEQVTVFRKHGVN